MKKDLKPLIPKYNRRGNKIHTRNRKKNLIISYKSGSHKVKLITPNKLNLDKKFFEGLGLAKGDGLNYPSITNPHFNFSNTDFKLIKKVQLWLKRFKLNNLSYYLILPNSQETNNNFILNLINFLKIKPNKLKIYYKDRTKQPNIIIQVNNAAFQLIYLNLFSKLKNYIFKNNFARRSFLSGIFAAEGHVKHSIYGTIENIIFCFNANKEKELAKFIKKCLEKEGIYSKIKIKNKSSLIVYFTDYNNLLKFFLIGGLESSLKKKTKFINLIQKSKIDIHTKSECLKLLKINQNNIAKKLNCSQPNISRILKRRSITLDYIKKIPKLKSILTIKNIRYITISNSYIKSQELIKLLLKLKKTSSF
ncbi:LAGLIDADG family homing endonuclease [Candidatus Woesearchaeota archaeon]|nr:LAGLIDADG family homing endonuclease [Candidatus Woesearchaeota archaeon]